MHHIKLWLQFCIVSVLILANSSCYSKQVVIVGQDESKQLPAFVVSLDLGQSEDGSHTMCVTVDQAVLVERGNEASQLAHHLQETATLSVDGVKLPGPDSSFMYTTYVGVFEDGEVIATHSGDISFCFIIEQLDVGQHIAMFSVESVSGIEYSYSWHFEITPVFR